MSRQPVFTVNNPTDEELISILDENYDDGVVFIPENTPWSLYMFACKEGYISDEGFVTDKGKMLVGNYKLAS